MTDRKVSKLLFLAILVVTVLPLTASLYFLDHALQTSLNLGFNQQIVRALETSSQNLRTLRDLDGERREQYRRQFEEVEDLKQVYTNPELIKGAVLESLKMYFALGLAAAVLLALTVAIVLGRRIARAYAQTFAELARHREQVRYLEQMSSWQDLARVLAHEIKNPLTPIEVLVTSLSRAYSSKEPEQFLRQLEQTQAMVSEELTHLKDTVNKFSDFARLPQAQAVEQNVLDMLRTQLGAIANTFDAARIHLDAGPDVAGVRARIDATLFRQLLTNIVRNGVESNPGRAVQFNVALSSEDQSLTITVSNDGEPVPSHVATRMFDPYVSTRPGKDNMGLGLAIVKKIVVEHGGEIAYSTQQGRPTFSISLTTAPTEPRP